VLQFYRRASKGAAHPLVIAHRFLRRMSRSLRARSAKQFATQVRRILAAVA